MAAAKMSFVMLYKRIAPSSRHSYYGLLMAVSFFTVFGLFTSAFQCPLPHPWVFEPAHCSSHGPLQYLLIVLNIVTDAMLAVGFLPTIWTLNMAKATKISVMVLFGSRIMYVSYCGIFFQRLLMTLSCRSVSFAAIGQIIQLGSALHSADQTCKYSFIQPASLAYTILAGVNLRGVCWEV